ncbi:MAG TPA: PGPGW domain-containing protein [Verrucomicrobiae bacterium]|nr:PGPGW domain-containing protein [Verrucomicrobiae bacterium]
MNWLIHHGKRVVRITSGVVVLIVGVILAIPGVPGPGLILIFVGLSILAVDFVWARRLKRQLKVQADKVVRKVRGQPEKSEPAEKP